MEITVKAVGDVVKAEGKSGKTYGSFELVYRKTGEDKSDTRKITQYAGAYKALLAASPGEVFEIDAVKEGDYWQWNKATSKGTAAPSARASDEATGASVTKARPSGRAGDWETAEERAAKQVMIVRLGCLKDAIEFAGLDREKAQGVQTDDIIAWAKEFAGYVFGEETEEPVDKEIDKRVE